MLLILIGVLVSFAHNGTRSYDICKDINFKNPACFEAEKMEEAGKFLKKL